MWQRNSFFPRLQKTSTTISSYRREYWTWKISSNILNKNLSIMMSRWCIIKKAYLEKKLLNFIKRNSDFYELEKPWSIGCYPKGKFSVVVSKNSMWMCRSKILKCQKNKNSDSCRNAYEITTYYSLQNM